MSILSRIISLCNHRATLPLLRGALLDQIVGESGNSFPPFSLMPPISRSVIFVGTAAEMLEDGVQMRADPKHRDRPLGLLRARPEP